MIGLYFLRASTVLGSSCCACTAAAACLTSEEVEMDFWSMTSDMLLFFRIGFFWRKELVLESRLTGSEVCVETDRLEAGCRGP